MLPKQVITTFRSVSILMLSVALSVAAPLDDQIAAFKSAPTQTEGAVSKILQSGITEHRSAQAFAAVKGWLAANPSPSQNLVFQAAQSAEYAGDWTSAVSFYRKFLKNPSVDAKLAAEAVPAIYRLLINHLGEPDAAYLFMREDGNRLRTFGRASQFDTWFLERAEERSDLVGWADRLAAIHNSNDSPAPYSGSLARLLGKLESFDQGGDALFASLKSLAAAKGITPEVQARLVWVTEIVPFNAKLAELVGAKQNVPDTLFDGPLRAAGALVAASPYEGSIIVVEGWMHYNAGDSGVFSSFMAPRREEKAAPLLKALQTMSADQMLGILERNVAGAKGRRVADYMFSPAELRILVQQSPAIFNALSAPDVPMFDKTLTAAEAKVLAPNLTRNPHLQAALVRAFANDERRSSAVIDGMVKTEMWRFDDVKVISQAVLNSGLFENDGDAKTTDQKYAQLDARYQQLKKQIAKGASAKDRLDAFNALNKDLLSPSPSITGALPLWDELFANAPDPERADLLIQLTADLQGDRMVLLKRAGRNCDFDKQKYAALYLGPDFVENWTRWGAQQTRKALPKFAAHVQGLLQNQMKAGTLSEPILGMWLYSVEPKQEAAKAFMAELVASPAYAKVNPAYRELAVRAEFFGESARIPGSEPNSISSELLALADDAAPAQVEAAFKTAVERASNARSPVAVTGLQKLAALPELTGATRDLALSLFRENSPLGPYPSGQGYEALVQRLASDLMDAKEWGTIEPYAAGLWRAAGATDDGRFFKGADALSLFAEAAQEAGESSIAMTVTRCAMNSYSFTVMGTHTEAGIVQSIGRLRQASGKAAVAIGAVEITVDETDPAYPIYKSNSEFVLGNFDSAWSLYKQNADKLEPILRQLSVEYGFWVLQRNTETGASARAEDLVKQLTIWSRQAEGTFSPQQEAELKIAYADLAFKKGALPTSRAWYRKVADAAEYEGTEIHLTAALGSVMVDRVSKDFGGAMTELDKLMRLSDPTFRIRVRYARAEVFMDQENYADALGEIDAVLRQEPKHADALILRGKIQYEMRKLVEASEIELGPSQDNTVIVPGEAVKINLRDPTLNVSGVGADIEVEIWAKSGDKERLLLNQLGDSKEKFRAEVPTALGPPVPGDKILQILGNDEIRFGYSERFRAKMDDLPADPKVVIGVASDAYLSFSAGAFPPREGERRLNIEELGLSTSQASLGTRAVRPGNPVYIRVTDPDQSKTPGIDEITVSLQASSGDEIRQLVMKETAPYSGEFEAVVPTTGAQALAFASESAPGRDPNMAISSQEYPGWQGNVGDKDKARTFGIDLNDNVAIDKMTIDMGGESQALTHFVLQTSMNGKDWTTRSRYPDNTAPWDGRPRVTSFPTYTTNKGAVSISTPEDRNLPKDWQEIMELTSARPSVTYLATTVKSLSAEPLPMVETGHPGYSGLVQYRALFYQPAAAIRRFQLTGYPATDDKGAIQTIFLIDGQPAGEEAQDPLLIERELAPGLHEIQIWRHEGRDNFLKRKPILLCDEPGKEELIPCPDAMFDPTTFPEGVRAMIAQTAEIKQSGDGKLEVAFGDKTRARLVRLVIQGFQGVAPSVHKVTLTNREGVALLPVAQDYRALRANTELEVLPGDQITARYEDPISATPKRTKHEQRLTVAFNDAVVSASFLNYKTTEEGRVLELEPIRRFRFDDSVAIVIDDADMDGSTELDSIDIKVVSSGGTETTIKAVETEEHSGRFIGRVFPVSGKPARDSEIQLEEGGTLTATYLDVENLNPGIPTERAVTISHAKYVAPGMETYTMSSELLPPPPEPKEAPPAAKNSARKRTTGSEIVRPRRTLDYAPSAASDPLKAVVGASLRFDVVVPHLALAGSSEIAAYVQTDAGRKALKGTAKAPFDVSAPGTLKLTGNLSRGEVEVPSGYQIGKNPLPPTNEPPLEEGRFSFSIPLILDDLPSRSFATNAAESLSDSSRPDGLAVRAGDTVYVGYAYKDEKDQVQWKTAEFKVGSHAFLDVMDGGYDNSLSRAYVGEKVYLRLLDRGLDRGPERDIASVTLTSTSGTETSYELQETEAHSGIFKSVFALSYAAGKPPAKLPPVALNGFPVGYGEDVVVSYSPTGDDVVQSRKVNVNMGADGAIEPFSKRFTGDEMAVRTSFTLAECFFELAKKHREMDQESLARREIGQARKLLAEAVATHRDDDLRAHAEYLLGNLSQEFADLSKNEEAKLPMYQDALARFSKIPSDYPDSEFAPKAQFKTALVYEKMGEIENSVEEYVKLSYKYPDNELIPTVMSRLGGYFQTKGLAFKKQGDPLREKEDDESKAEVLRLDELSYPEFLNAAMVFSKLQQRFPDDTLAGLAGLRAAQNFMRARQYGEAIRGFAIVAEKEEYDGREIRSQALYWSGLSHERLVSTMTKDNWKGTGRAMNTAYQTYRRVTFDFPDSIWAKYARGRLADPVFADIIDHTTR